MTDSIIEEPGDAGADVSQPVVNDFTTPKSKKKKKKDKVLKGEASSEMENSFCGERQDVSYNSSAETQVYTEDKFSTAKKKNKKKQENDGDIFESAKKKENKGNEMDVTFEVNGDVESCNISIVENEDFESCNTSIVENEDFESCNTSIVENEDFEVPHKKKKKKKKGHAEESMNETQTEIVYEENGGTEGCDTSVVENESSEVTHKKKKKKKKSFADDSIDEPPTLVPICDENGGFEGCDASNVEDESSSVLHKKKKKKKKRDLEENIDEKQTNPSYEEEEESVKLSSKKKKKRKRDETEESKDNTLVENGLSADETEDKNESILKSKSSDMTRKKKKKSEDDDNNINNDLPKKKKVHYSGESHEMEDEDHPNDVNKTMEDEGTTEDMQESSLGQEADNEGSNVVGGFTVIDRVKVVRKQKVYRVLPEWLSNPTVVSMNLTDGIPVGDLKGVAPFILKRLNAMEIKTFFPVQAAVIPELLASSKSISMRYRPRDICVSAPTGSGKTLSYVLPIIQALKNRVVPQLRALVILPTRELAIQVHNVFKKYMKFSKLRLCLAISNQNFKKEQESLVFEDAIGDCAADILVATPGKLADHLSFTERLSFKYLRFLVMDEADLFLSSSGGSLMGQIDQLKKRIRRLTPDNSVISGGFQPSGSLRLPEPYLQQILISATLMHDPEQLKVLDLHQPKLFIAGSNVDAVENSQMVGPYIRPQEIREEYVIVDSTLKPLLLHHLIASNRLRRVLVFTKSKTATRTLTILLSELSKRYSVASFSSIEGKRKNILADFSSGKINVLVSSDAMARGIDVSRIEQVVSYDVPSVQTYVHRIGRTGRAGKQGFALTLVEDTPQAKSDFKEILSSCKDRLIKINIKERELRGYDTEYKSALATLKEKYLTEKKEEKLRTIKNKVERLKKSKAKKKLNKKT